ncbi:Upstream activation factor subunit spp27 like [Actinidia chinensis var. chinensis]|uniref:Upstream activation factor subunit spp27 like n=1 Tax=Actinidia chinensis var. chinensis TaxID=1590841 RepID=A0A2R6PT94_ACTCC|nr:Upstream activation factor subunit spp27 like [Actinidia chinensis var. chinensis]
MSERGPTMVSDQDIAQALDSLLRQTNPNTTLNSLNDVVQHLESKTGLDLTHKVDFIRTQIHLLLRPPPPSQPPHHQHHSIHQPTHPNDRFALHQNPNFHSPPAQLSFHPPLPLPLPAAKTEAFFADVAPSADAAVESTKESSQTGRKRRGGPGGLNKLCGITPELQAIVGQPEMPRTEIVKQLWAYIRKNNLQDPSNRRKIICNDELRLVFETDCTDMFKMNKLLAKHIITLDPTKSVGQSSKKPKVEVESGAISAESGPVVIISEALANFFGTGEREMLHSEV